MQKWRLFSLSAQKYDCCAPAIPPHHLERQSEGRGMSSRPVLTAALPLTEWPQTPTLGPVPSFFFFLYEHMSKLFGYCCHRQPNTREWAQETTPCVSSLPPQRRMNSHSELGQPLKPASRQTDRPLHCQKTDSWSEWVTHSWAKAVVWDSCVRVQRFTEMREWFLQALFPRKKNWDVPLYNWVRSEK